MNKIVQESKEYQRGNKSNEGLYPNNMSLRHRSIHSIAKTLTLEKAFTMNDETLPLSGYTDT